MLTNNRIFFKDNSVLRDLSVTLNDINSGSETLAIVAAEDAILIGSDLPFNHRYFEVSSANALASVVSVYLWNGAEWKAAVDVIDQTAVSGKTFAQSGIISWVPDKEQSWPVQLKSSTVTELSSTMIYEMYWVKIVFSGNLTASTAISYVGHKFSNDSDLSAEYPELGSSAILTAFESGKTDWNTQEIIAAEYIVDHLRSMGVINSSAQILDWQRFNKASVHKTAEIAFGAFGEDYKDQLAMASRRFKAAIELRSYNVDQDADGRVSPVEKTRASEALER